MPLYNAGQLIKELRIAKGFSQQQLAEGICARQSVYMIERGHRKPEWVLMKSLLLRLGIAPETYYSEMTSSRDVYIIQKFNECAAYVGLFNFEALKKGIEALEQDKIFNSSSGGGI